MRKSKITAGTCKTCRNTGYAPTGCVPSGFVLREKKAPLGVRMQAAGSAMSIFSGGASKGGYAAQAAHSARTGYACASCGSAKVSIVEIKVPVERAQQLLKGSGD